MMALKSILGTLLGRQIIKADDSAFARIIARTVVGQVRSFVNDHPEMLAPDARRQHVVASISKRIINDLLCADTGAQLRATLDGFLAPSEADVCARSSANVAADAAQKVASAAQPPLIADGAFTRR